MQAILVTGGAGFIGSNMVAALAARGERVVVCDWLGAGETGDKWRNIAKHDLVDMLAPEALFDWLGEEGYAIGAVVHMGAISATTERDADKIMDNNFRLSRRLWRWCAEQGKRFIYASSAATYGDGSVGFDDDFSRDALAELRPLNAYGWSKHLFDRRVARALEEGEDSPPQWAGLKFFNVYGPNEYHKGGMKSVVAQAYPTAAAGEAVTLFRSHNPDYEDGGQLRDFVYVDDCVEVMLWLLDHPDVSGLYNLGTGEARSFRELAEALFKALGREPKITYRDTPIEIRDKYQYYTQANMEKLRNAGFDKPFTSLEEGVRSCVQDYLMRDDPYR